MSDRAALRKFVAGALCDFLGYLDSLEDPIVVGKRYNNKLLIAAFTRWLKKRNVSVEDADGKQWLTACASGALAASKESNDESPK